MKPRHRLVLLLAFVLTPALASAQINFPKHSYYVGMGDSVAAGEGALPVTNGYVYRLYDEGVFGKKQEMDFSNMAIRGSRSWDLRDHQAPQVLCAEPEQRPTVVTITAGANDFFRNDPDVVSSAKRVAQAVDLLLNNDGVLSPTLGAVSVLDPVRVNSAALYRTSRCSFRTITEFHTPSPPYSSCWMRRCKDSTRRSAPGSSKSSCRPDPESFSLIFIHHHSSGRD